MNAGSRKSMSTVTHEEGATTPLARTKNSTSLKPLVGKVNCGFFKLGSCRAGDGCRFRHSRAGEDPIVAQPSSKSKNTDPIETHTRELGGALVTFGAGAEVIDVKPADKPGRLQMCNVSCAWYLPSKTACLEFRSTQYMEEAASRLSDCTILDRKIQWRAVVDKNVRPWLILLKLGNLHVSTTERMLRGVCKINQPRQVTFGEASYSSSTTEIAAALQQLLASIGILRNWFMAPDNKGQQCKATATFSTPEEATKAVWKFNGYKLPQLGGSRIFLSRYIKAKYSIMTLLYKVVSAELRQVAQNFHSRNYLDIRCYEDANKNRSSTIVQIVGNMASDVGKAKAAVEKILGGHTAKSGRVTLWDPLFLQPECMNRLKDLGNQHKVFIYRDTHKCLLRLYGSDKDMSKVEIIIAKAVKDIAASESKITLHVQVPTACYHAGYLRIVGKLGKGSARLNLTTSPKTLTIFGSTEDVAWAKAVLLEESNQKMKSDSSDGNEFTCAVCWCNVSDVCIITPCGHLYDRDCFVDQCRCAGDTDIPIKCLGSTGDCQEIIPFTELEANLTKDRLEKLLENSFTGYVRTHPESYQYCPTAGCDQVHQLDPDAQEQVFTCTTCLTSICTFCGAISHESLTCEQYKRTLLDDESFAEWKRENNAKDCPRCGCPIQKSEGCNHMQCTICKAHMCWMCLKVFSNESKTYDHMSEEHGGDYDEDSDDEFDDERSDYEDDDD